MLWLACPAKLVHDCRHGRLFHRSAKKIPDFMAGLRVPFVLVDQGNKSFAEARIAAGISPIAPAVYRSDGDGPAS